MANTYENFIAQKIKELDLCIVRMYSEYETYEYDDYAILPENSDKWFDYYFIHFINDEYSLWFDEFQVIRVDISNNFVFKEQLTDNYSINSKKYNVDIGILYGKENVEKWLKNEINKNFVNNYIYNILDFEYFKNILYENGIYPEVFAEEVELK